MNEPCDLGADEARRLIGTKELSPVELLESCIARIAAVNPALNAIVATAYDRARAEALDAERAAQGGEALPALHGLPVGIKDQTETAGLRTTFGSPLFGDHVPARDDRIVQALRAAGAIVLGKTNMPEWGAGAVTTNPVYGRTGNPFDPARTSGGSSGGSAAALAAGMVALATGSDIGGSLRTPAAWCGVVGFRPTPGVVANRRTLRGWSPMGVDGPMARSVGDVALMLSALAGEDRQDPQSRPVDPAAFLTLPRVDLATRRVGFSEDLGFAPVDPDIRHVFRQRMAALAPAFRAAHTVDVGLGSAYDTFTVLRGAYFVSLYGRMVEATPEKVGPLVTENTRYGATLSLADVLAAEAEQTRLYRRFQSLFEDIDLLICPAAAVSPFDKAEPYARVIDGVPAKTYMDWLAITFGLSLTACPIVCQPCGRDAAGMPFGIQVVGPHGADREVLGAALALERTMAADPALARPVPDIRALAVAEPDRVNP